MSRTDPERPRRPVPPLDTAALERLALRYVERFQTTRARLTQYLQRKVRERGWDGVAADPAGLAQRMADLGYIDDRAFGEARAGAMARRGLGRRRVAGALRAAGIGGDDLSEIAEAAEENATESALAFARRRRIGPFSAVIADRPLREKQIAAMIRGGHDFDLARKITEMTPGQEFDGLD